MRTRRVLPAISLLVSCVLLLLPRSAYSIHTDETGQDRPEFSRTRLILKLKPEADRGISLGKVQGRITTGLVGLDSLNLKFKVKKQERLFKEFKETALRMDDFSSVYILEVPPGTDLQNMRRVYAGRPEVEYVELDYRVELFEEGDDPLFPHQWYLNNTGQGYLGIKRVPGGSNDTQVIKYGTQDADADALEAFERNDETTIPLVGIIDTGVDLDHVDLADNVWTNPGETPGNGIDDDHNGFVDDFHGWDFSGDSAAVMEDNDPTDTDGHGTHCAGIVAAVRGNGIGISGLNTPCRVMAIKSFPNAFFSLSARSIIYATDMGCDVINMSWGSPLPSKLIEDALDYAISRGVLPIAAAGNSGAEDSFYPAALPQVFTVGASNSDDEVTHFSTYGDYIDVVAPGEDILSLRGDSTDMYAGGGASGIEPTVHIVDDIYYLADGTSMASPCAVGVAAYILAASPGISAARVREIIEQSADDVIHPYGGDSPYSPGKDIYSGYGRVNLNSALELLSGRLAKIDYPYENAIVSGEVAVMGTASGDSFQNYVLEYGEGFSPGEWTEIISSDVPVTSDTLGVWNSISLAGLYTLRLTVGDQNQALVRLIAGNEMLVMITSPADGDTIRGWAQVWGYTIVPDFSRYTLEYGYGESPSFWFPIDSSTRMVADYILGNWLVSFFEEMSYTLRLTVETNAGETYADSVTVVVKSIASSGWVRELSANGSLCPGVGDVDGDGYEEIVVGIGGPAGSGLSGGLKIFSHQGEREPGWSKDSDKNMMSSPALGDLDGDGIDDIVICSDQGVHAYVSDSPDWFRSAGTGGNAFWSLATSTIADLENDGNPEVLMMNNEGVIYAWRGEGTPVTGDGVFAQAQSNTWDMDFPSLAVADLDADGENEVIAAAAHPTSGRFGDYEGVGGIYVWDIRGHPLLEPEDYPDRFVHVFGIAVANIDQNEDLEIVALGSNETHCTLSAMKKDGTQASGFPKILEDLTAGWWFGNHPALGDLDGDGNSEIVVSLWTFGEARIYGWHQDGRPLGLDGPLVSIKSPGGEREREVLSGLGSDIGEITAKIRSMSQGEQDILRSTFEDRVFASEAETFGSPVLADVNGDGYADVVARAGYFLGSGFERVLAWDYEGNLIPGFPLYASAEANLATFYPYTPAMVDPDRDGRLNMVMVADYNIFVTPKLISWEFDTDFDTGATPWPKYMHDRWNSGRSGFKPPESEMVNLPPHDFRVQNWDDTSVTFGWTPKAPWTSLGYNLYRGTISGQLVEKINIDLIPHSDSQYQDTGLLSGQCYHYTITNVNTDSEESDRSPEVEVTVGQPSAPAGLQAQAEEGIVTLRWLSNPIEEDVLNYAVYHKGPNYSRYHLSNSVAAETSYVDSSLKWAGDHHYQISAINSIGSESYFSEAVQMKIQHSGYLPRDLELASWYGTDVILSWRVSQEGMGCNIYRSADPGIYDAPPLNSRVIEDSIGAAITYQDGGLTEGVAYYYVVTQIRGGIENPSSHEVEFLAGRPQTLTSLTGEVRDCHIVIHWNPSIEGDIVEYRIYDRIAPENDYVLIGSVEEDTIYIHPATDDSLEHRFVVTAVDSAGLESYFPSFPATLPGHVNGPLYPPHPPSEFKMSSYTDTSITFKVFAPGVQAYNIYRSTASGEYTEGPINPQPIPSYHPYQYVYLFTPRIEGQNNFFNATCIKENECGTSESRIDSSREMSFIPGLPRKVGGVIAELDTNCNAVVTWTPNPEGDIVGYRIYHKAAFEDVYQVIDSVPAPATAYVDTSLSDSLRHYYAVTAVDSLGLEGPRSNPASVWPTRPYSVWLVEVTDWTDSSVALCFGIPSDQDIIGFNVYRSLVPGYYAGLEPINDTPLPVDSAVFSYYTDLDVTEGTTYFYTATSVNKCGLESEFLPFDYLGDSVLVGRPHEPLLEARSGKEGIKLRMSSSESDVEGYRISRSESDGPFEIMQPFCTDSVYTDTFAVAGVGYHYRVAAIDTLGLEGLPSPKAEGCIMSFDRGIILVDMTRGEDRFDGVRGDSVDAFYQRALEGYDCVRITHDHGTSLSLFEMSSHPIAIVHSVDERAGYGIDLSSYRAFGSYLQAGGALLIEGRRNLWHWSTSPELGGFLDFSPGDFTHDYLGIDSARVPDNLQSGATPEFIAADRTPHLPGYPETVELDTFRVNHAYDPYWPDLEGRLPGVGYFMPSGQPEVLYTFSSAYDTSASEGKPVALKHFTDDFAVIYFDFPLYFVKEDMATRIVQRAIADLEEFAYRPAPVLFAGDLTDASVFPNPFKPYRGHTHVTFDGLTDRARIEVFSITGERVRTIEESDGDGEVSWDVTNSEGRRLASGIYIYRITDQKGHEKVSKFAVIR